MDHPEGAGLQRADRVEFDPRVRLEFRGTQLRRKMLAQRSDSGDLHVTGSPLGECRFKRGASKINL